MNRFNDFERVNNTSEANFPEKRPRITLARLQNASSPSDDNVSTQWETFNGRCSIFTYTNKSKFIKYLRQAQCQEYVIAIIVFYPIKRIERIIHQLQQYRLSQKLFIVTSEEDANNNLYSINDNICVCRTQESMFECLKKRIEEIEEQDLTGGFFTTLWRKETSLKHVQNDSALFILTFIFKVLFRNVTPNCIEDKRQMFRECRAYYRNNRSILDEIDKFQRTYQSKDAILWYTKPNFVHSIINKALRSQDILIMYKFRFFIMDLSSCLEKLSHSQSLPQGQLYRGAKVNRDELDQLQDGWIISMNGFLSWSYDRKVAEIFIDNESGTPTSPTYTRNRGRHRVLFIIDVDCNTRATTVVADVKHLSFMKDEQEVIFDFGSTFLINDISFDNDKSIWLIKMSMLSDSSQVLDEYKNYVDMRLQHISPTLMFGNYLANNSSDFGQSLIYFHRLLKRLPINHIERPAVYYNLGRIYRLIEKYKKALQYFRCARLIIRRLLPERIFDYCRILGGMGTIYSQLGDSEKAIKLLEQALTLHKKSFPNNHTEIPFHLNRLGHAYLKAKQFDRAILILVKAAVFFQNQMPVNHQGYSQTLHTMGLVYRALDNNEEALSLFEKALQEQRTLLGQFHPRLASTYYQIGLIHKNRAEYRLAFDFIQTALHIQSVKLPHNHSELKMSRQLLEYLQQYQ